MDQTEFRELCSIMGVDDAQAEKSSPKGEDEYVCFVLVYSLLILGVM